jgi:2-polyprenyl-6-hydroxyphenyl methylase/3-demethylubiquinone-9 3-methyltransferase
MANIDPLEIAKFEILAQEWWDPNGSSKPLHDINPFRLKFITDILTLDQKKVLDVGCGGGLLSESMAQQRAQVTAIDMSESLIEIAKHHAQEQNLRIHYQQMTVENLAAQSPNSFDVITCMEMLEHVPNPISVIQACANLIKEGGYLFFSTLNRNLKAYLGAIIGAEYILGLLPKGTHDYQKFIRPSELDSWARAAGLNLVQIKGLSYNPLTQQYRLSTNLDINYLICYRKD